MTNETPESDLVSEEEIEQSINAAVQKLLVRMGFDAHPSEVKELLAENDKLPPNDRMPKLMEMAFRFAFGSFANKYKTGIRTREDLAKVLHTIGEASEQAPTMARATLKQLQRNLPRRGGPGRIPKLNPEESARVCDEIARYIRQGLKVKEAIAKASNKCPELIGKTVSPRTLETTWSKRKESS
jgi:hypothetical protein